METFDRYRLEEAAERRRHRRLSADFPVYCTRVGRGGFQAAARALDISPGGVRIRTPTGLQVGDVVALTLEAGDIVVEVTGLVVQVAPGDTPIEGEADDSEGSGPSEGETEPGTADEEPEAAADSRVAFTRVDSTSEAGLARLLAILETA